MLLGTGHKVQGGGGWAMKFFFLSTSGFQWPTPEIFDKIGVAYPWSGTEKTRKNRKNQPPYQNQ